MDASRQPLQQLDAQVVDLLTRYDSEMAYERHPFIPTREAMGEVLGEARSLREAARILRGSGSATERIFGRRIHDLMDSLMICVRNDGDYPHRFLDHVANKLNTVTLEDARPDEERLGVLYDILSRTPEIFDATRRWAADLPARQLKMYANSLAAFEPLIERLRPHLRAAFPDSDADALQRMQQSWDELVGRAREAGASLPAPKDRPLRVSYQETLEGIYGVPLDYLVQHHRQEVDRCFEELHAAVDAVSPGRDPFDILQTDVGPCDDPEEMFVLAEEYLELARRESLRYITLSEGESCHVRRIPEYYRETNPWGGYYYYASGPLTGNVRGAVFLNQYNYRAITRGWLMMLPIHECYPGHHAQYVKTAAADMPLSFKASSSMVGPGRGSPLAEGIAHRAEKLLEPIYNDPGFPVFVAYRRLHTAVRIWADLKLFHWGEGPESAVTLYQELMRFSDAEARGQVLAQEMTPGYFTVYNYGMRELDRLQEASGWSDPAYTEAMFSCGKVSLGVFQELLDMKADERDGLLSNFSTLTEGSQK